MSHTDATRLLREGRFLTTHPLIAQAALSGQLSASQIGLLRKTVTEPTAALFAEHQQLLINQITNLNLADSELVCALWRQRADAIVEMPEPKVPEQTWKTSTLDDGTMIGRFVLNPASAAHVDQAIGTAKNWEKGDTRTHANRSADAVVEIFAFFNANHHKAGTPRHLPHVELHINLKDFVEDANIDFSTVDFTKVKVDDFAADHGINLTNFNNTNAYTRPHAFTNKNHRLSANAADEILCDCVIHRVIHAGSMILDYGHKTRAIPMPLFRALVARDGGCRFDGCDRPASWTHGHHIKHWPDGGPTRADNLILLCQTHHTKVHQEKWVITLRPNGEAHFTKDGVTRISQPRGSPYHDPIAA